MILLTQHTLDLRKFTPSKLTVNLCPLANGEALGQMLDHRRDRRGSAHTAATQSRHKDHA
jgi:hypothetical protein